MFRLSPSMTLGTLFLWLAALAPVVAIVAANGLAPLLALAVVAGGALLWRDRRLPEIPLPPAVLLGTLLAWALISLIWSLIPERGVITVMKLAVMLMGGLMLASAARTLSPESRRRVGIAFCCGVFAALALVGLEIFTPMDLLATLQGRPNAAADQPYFLNRAATILAVFLWPALLVVRRRFGLPACLAGMAAGTAVLASTESTTAAVSVAVGMAVAAWGLVGRGTVLLRRLVMAGVLVALLGAPAYSLGKAWFGDEQVTGGAVSSMLHRLYIWDFAATKIREKPVFGWGMDSSRAIPGGHTGRPADGRGTLTEVLIRSYKSMLLPLHPHNGGLQIWLELGLPGILLAAGFLMWLLHAIGRSAASPTDAGLCLAQFVAAFGVAELAYGIWQSWWIATLVLGTVFTAALLPRERAPPGSG